MTDDSCGCDCFPCRTDDRHDCGRQDCGYTKYRRMSKPVEHPEPIDVPPILRAQFNSIRDPGAKVRLTEWQKFCNETATLEPELRDAKRREKYAEVFG